MTTGQCLSQALFLGGFPSTQKITIPVISPQMAAKLCALNLFFGLGNELQMYHGNILSMDNKHSKLFVVKQPNYADLCLKCNKIRLAAGLMRSPRPPSQWCIAKNGGGYKQRGVAKGLKVPCLFMITEVSIRCQKNPGGWYTPYTRVYPPNTPLLLAAMEGLLLILCGRLS